MRFSKGTLGVLFLCLALHGSTPQYMRSAPRDLDQDLGSAQVGSRPLDRHAMGTVVP